ncbi:MAG: ATP synthase F1 subunit epsilon [Clostridia bacterium]|jgi:F-type H+-transporting ATPase subunit epsilon|nr:ATP synthase F1 subunit epsilon [Clostridia bacterium]MBT7122854.1 ATP synthase F1 subunit epsilon [Clostridia bacterium]
MPEKYTLEIITPERIFFRGEVQSVIIPTSDGYMSIQKMHEPMVATIVVGDMKLQIDGEWKQCTTTDGFVEVRPDETIIFSQAVEWPEEIDLRRAQEARERAEEQLRQKKSHQEYMQNQIALARAMVRLRVGRRNRNLE